jgi:thymidine kinase
MEVITGPMFSGKSEELIRRLKRAQIAKLRVASFKPNIDLRYQPDAISSHSAHTIEALAVPDVERLRSALFSAPDDFDVVGIDEAQFFTESLVALAMDLVHAGKRVILAGLDTTFAGEPFPPMPSLMAVADDVVKLSAVCTLCGAPAIHTQRLGTNQQLVVVGAEGVYEARCRACFRPEGDMPAAEQLHR